MPARIATALLFTFLSAAIAPAQNDGEPPVTEEIDECGVIVRGQSCFLLEVAGGRFYVADYGGYQEGDTVHVTGTVDRSCITICGDADGCIRGAVLYNPTVFPCGEPIPDPQIDICGSAASGLAGALGLALWFSRPAHRPACRRTAGVNRAK